MTQCERYAGCLLGLAVGDALGTTLEFKSPGTFEPITDMIGGGPFGLNPSQWTDDTSMALCLATSLVECQSFDAAQNGVQIVERERSLDLPVAFHLNYRGFLGSCLPAQFPVLIQIFQV